MCGGRSEYVSGTGKSLTLPGYSLESHHLHLIYEKCCFYRIRFQKGQWSLSEFFVTLAVSRPEDAFFDLTANSIFGVMLLSIAVKSKFWIVSSTVLTTLPISLSILSVRLFSSVWTSTVLSSVTTKLSIILVVNSRSDGLSLTTTFCVLLLTASPKKHLDHSYRNCLKDFCFAVFFRVEIIHV